MKDELTSQVDMLLSEGKSRLQIWKRLKNSENPGSLRHCLNNKALLKDKKAYRFLNIFLLLILLFVTISKIVLAVDTETGVFFFASLVVPMINLYILKELFFFRRSGYLFLCILSAISFIHPENQHFPEFLFILAMIAIAAFLYFKLFPKKLLIPAPSDKPGDKKVK